MKEYNSLNYNKKYKILFVCLGNIGGSFSNPFGNGRRAGAPVRYENLINGKP